MSRRGLTAFRLAALALALYGVAPLANQVLRAPERLPGGEAYWIAQSVAAGKGFSMPEGHRWLFDAVDNNMFLRLTNEPVHPTAWSDPLYTLSLAAILRLAGARFQFWAALMNVVLLVLALLFAYLLAESLGAPVAGILALLFLINVNGFTQRASFGMVNTQLAAALIAGSALGVAWYFKRPSIRRAGAVGFLLGVTALGCPAALLFIPGTAAGFLLHEWRMGRIAVMRAGMAVLVAALVIFPWTARNYRALHQPVPVRTGFGQIAFIGTVALGAVVDSTTLGSMAAPPIEAASARGAVKALLRPPFREIAALEQWQLEYAKQRGGPEYEQFNEAERDGWFLAESKSFLRANPGLGARLAVAKLETFVRIFGGLGILVCLLAAVGGVMRGRTPTVTVLVLWVVAFVFPYLVAVTYYARYRSPIEPILAVLAGLGVWAVVRAIIPPARRLERASA